MSKSETEYLRQTDKSKRRLFFILASFLTGAAIIFTVIHSSAKPHVVESLKPSVNPTSFKELLALSPEQLAKCDIAAMNLLCAEGLPGAEGLDIPRYMKILDAWTDRVRSETERNFHRFRENPAESDYSEAKWRMGMLITVLWLDFRVHYNPNRIDLSIPDQVFYSNSQDLFLNGLLGEGRTGTCVSMPVLYVAVARRLGYPVKLVMTKIHVFARWESVDGKERFNIEGTNHGFNYLSDEEYKKWPMPITEAEIRANHYLQSMTASEEMALFAATRGNCLQSIGRQTEAWQAYAFSHHLVPHSPEDNNLPLTSAGNGVSRGIGANANTSIQSHAEIERMAAEVMEDNRKRRELIEQRMAEALRGAQNSYGPKPPDVR